MKNILEIKARRSNAEAKESDVPKLTPVVRNNDTRVRFPDEADDD